MTPIEQRYSYDCLTACLATVFDCAYEDAPVLADPGTCDPVDQWLRVMTMWVRERGYGLWTSIGLWGDERPYLKYGSDLIHYVFRPPGVWVAGVKSPRYDGEHAVVMRADKIVWDPHPQREMGHLGFTSADVFVRL